jgi:hypothetical protein
MIRKVEAERDAAPDNAGQASMLTRLGGIAAISAHVLVNETLGVSFCGATKQSDRQRRAVGGRVAC